MDAKAFQEEPYFQGNHCFGCSPDNAKGLQIKSRWEGEESVCTYQADADQCAGWPHVMYGGLISSLIDCHCVCTAIAAYNRDAARSGGTQAQYWFASVSLKVDFLKPSPVDQPVTLRARIKELGEKKGIITCSVFSNGQETARGEVVAVRVPAGAGPGAKK
jgi:acyl-coenzyme A thioesterase PaaI-like protein